MSQVYFPFKANILIITRMALTMCVFTILFIQSALCFDLKGIKIGLTNTESGNAADYVISDFDVPQKLVTEATNLFNNQTDKFRAEARALMSEFYKSVRDYIEAKAVDLFSVAVFYVALVVCILVIFQVLVAILLYIALRHKN